MKILVLGYIVRGPLGGLAWHHLQYVLCLKHLGHSVLFLEDSDDFASCYDPSISELTTSPIYGLAFINKLFDQFNLKNNWSYYDAHTGNWFGLQKSKTLDFCRTADVLLNISGVNKLRQWWMNIPAKVFIDTDPGFVQIKHLTEINAMQLAEQHTCFFSFGENIGKSVCKIPQDGFHWLPTHQPVYLPAWNVSSCQNNAKWTTIMQWDSYKQKEYNGLVFGMKSSSFHEYFTLPQYFPKDQFELAIGSQTAPLSKLIQHGWGVISSLIPTKTAGKYQKYINSSKGEWSVAKQGYVTSNSGWFSERSLCYMASGKPVVVQDTGFSAFLPSESGILSFTTLNEAIEKIEKAESNYKFHCLKAREIVEEFFDGTHVLQNLLKSIN